MTPYEFRARCWYGDCHASHAREARINAGVRDSLRKKEEARQQALALKARRLEMARQYKNGDQIVTPNGLGLFAGIDKLSGSIIVIINKRRRSYSPEVLKPCC